MDFIGSYSAEDYAIALGNFDGAHLGHQQVIKTAKQKAREIGCKSAVVTFAPHPAKVISGSDFKEILSFNEKISILQALGVDDIIIINFTESFSQMPAESFINELCQKLNIRSITTGYNFRYGHNRHGSISTINNLKNQYKFKFNVVNQVLYKNSQISSSILRQIIKVGCVRLFSDFTGRNYTIDCIIQSEIDNILICNVVNIDLLLPPAAVYLGEINGNPCCVFFNTIELKIRFLNEGVKILTTQLKIRLLTILGQELSLDKAIANDVIVKAYIAKAKFYLN
jgi:cytidyltransferase-like protein